MNRTNSGFFSTRSLRKGYLLNDEKKWEKKWRKIIKAIHFRGVGRTFINFWRIFFLESFFEGGGGHESFSKNLGWFKLTSVSILYIYIVLKAFFVRISHPFLSFFNSHSSKKDIKFEPFPINIYTFKAFNFIAQKALIDKLLYPF